MPSTLTYRCTDCKATSTHPFDASTSQLACTHCQSVLKTNSAALQNGKLIACLACPCDELFLRKDFPQRLGVTIVVVGLGLSCVTWMFHMLIPTFGILFITALVDVVLFMFIGDVVECYRCHAQYRGTDNTQPMAGFDLEIHERHRQLEARKAQLRQPAR